MTMDESEAPPPPPPVPIGVETASVLQAVSETFKMSKITVNLQAILFCW
jgi:hypothetical protein